MQYFGSNIVEGVAESWVEVEMSCVEVSGAGWTWVEVEMSWVEVDETEWRWMELGGGGRHSLVIPIFLHKLIELIS